MECLNDNNWVVLNIDDKAVSSFRKKYESSNYYLRIFRVGGFSSFKLQDGRRGIVFKVSYKGNIVPVKLAQFFGRHNVYTALSAIGARLGLRGKFGQKRGSCFQMKPPLGRMNLLEGINGSLIFDDSYTSPLAAEAAIEVLSEYPAKEESPFWAI